MDNISGFGLSIQVTASKTFPNGFTLTQFGDDTDPLDTPDLQVADTSFGLNGDFLVWNRPAGIEIAVAVIAGSDDDQNLSALHEANRIGKNKSAARDVIGTVVTYPDGARATTSKGVIVTGPIATSVSSAGRYKTKVYRFRFESVSKTNG